LKKPEITLKSISGGMVQAMETGKYPQYYTLWSRKYKRSWRFEEFPVELKVKGEVVYKIMDESTILDKNGLEIEDVEFIVQMRD